MQHINKILVHEDGSICMGMGCPFIKQTHYNSHLPLEVLQVLNRDRGAVLSAAASLDALGKFGDFKPHMSLSIRMAAALASMSVALLTNVLNPRVASSKDAQKSMMTPLLAQLQRFVRELEV